LERADFDLVGGRVLRQVAQAELVEVVLHGSAGEEGEDAEGDQRQHDGGEPRQHLVADARVVEPHEQVALRGLHRPLVP
jgi:hypothetical protein